MTSGSSTVVKHQAGNPKFGGLNPDLERENKAKKGFELIEAKKV
jgi:hypothetical protein